VGWAYGKGDDRFRRQLPCARAIAVGPSVYYILKATYYQAVHSSPAAVPAGGVFGFRRDHAMLAGTFCQARNRSNLRDRRHSGGRILLPSALRRAGLAVSANFTTVDNQKPIFVRRPRPILPAGDNAPAGRARHTRLSRRAHLAGLAPAKEIDEVLQPPRPRLLLGVRAFLGRRALDCQPRPNLEITRLTPDPFAISSGARGRGSTRPHARRARHRR
jgi:hypothetical protein